MALQGRLKNMKTTAGMECPRFWT